MEEIVNLIMTNGFGVVLLAYFIFKDYKFNQQIINIMDKVTDVLGDVKTTQAEIKSVLELLKGMLIDNETRG